MTDEQINTAISKALNADEHWMRQKDYCNCLNAMHEAEMKLTSVQLDDYVARLFDACYEATVATARVRAKEFLKTLDKWEEV